MSKHYGKAQIDRKLQYGSKEGKALQKRSKTLSDYGPSMSKARAILESNPAEVIRLLNKYVDLKDIQTILLITKAHYALNDFEGLQKLFKRLESMNFDTLELKTYLYRFYFENEQYDKIVKLYYQIKARAPGLIRGSMLIFRSLIELGNFQEARNLFFERTKLSEEEKSQMMKDYLSKSLSKPEFFRDAMVFIKLLDEHELLKNGALLTIVNTLYEAKQYLFITQMYGLLEPTQRTIKVTVLYLHALRKLKRYQVVIDFCDSLLSKYTLKTDKLEWAELSTIKAYCLHNQYKHEVARKLFSEVISQIGPKDAIFDWALCGYIFCAPELDFYELEAYKEHIKIKLQLVVSPGLLADLRDALDILNRDYIVE